MSKKKSVTDSIKVSAPASMSSVSADKGVDTRKGVQSVEHAFALLDIFAASDRELAIKEVSELSGMPASKVHHYLVSLVRMGAIRQTRSGVYDLGTFALQLGLSALRRLQPVELAVDAAQRLREQTGEATFVSVWGSHGPTIIRYIEGQKPVTVEFRVGNVLPLAASATGRVYLAWGLSAVSDSMLKRENISRSQCEDLGEQTRASGLGQVDGELLPRIAALAAPVFDHDGHLALVLTTLGWSGGFDLSPDGATAAALIRCADQLSHDLGFADQ